MNAVQLAMVLEGVDLAGARQDKERVAMRLSRLRAELEISKLARQRRRLWARLDRVRAERRELACM